MQREGRYLRRCRQLLWQGTVSVCQRADRHLEPLLQQVSRLVCDLILCSTPDAGCGQYKNACGHVLVIVANPLVRFNTILIHFWLDDAC